MIIGVDLGNYQVKTSEKVHFVNKVTEEESFVNESSIFMDKTTYYFNTFSNFSTEYDKSKKEYILPTLYYSLAKSAIGINVFDVVIGLPMDQYKKRKTELSTTIYGNNLKKVIIDGKYERTISIRNIEVAPEGASCIYSLPIKTREQVMNRNLIIVDIGGGTTEVVLFKENKIVKSKTINIGTISVYSDISNYVNKEFTTNYSLEDGEDILKNGLFVNGPIKDNSFIKPLLMRNFNKIWNELSKNFDINKSYLYLTGGGAYLFEKAFRNRLGDNFIMSENPQFDNANGFKKLGVNKWYGNN